MTCYVVDNEPHAIDVIRRHIESTPGLMFLEGETNPLVAMKRISSGEIRPDLTFLDIEMPEFSGLDMVNLISTRTQVVITTAHPDFALKAFERDVFDFLAKPVSLERFRKTIERSRDGYRFTRGPQGNQYFFIRGQSRGKWIKVPFKDLAYVEAAQNYVRFHVQGRSLLVYLTLKEVKANLPKDRFLQVHRSYIVNLDQVESLDGGLIHLSSGQGQIQISSGYRREFESRFRDFVWLSSRSR